jgi:hypothetical protein
MMHLRLALNVLGNMTSTTTTAAGGNMTGTTGGTTGNATGTEATVRGRAATGPYNDYDETADDDT